MTWIYKNWKILLNFKDLPFFSSLSSQTPIYLHYPSISHVEIVVNYSSIQSIVANPGVVLVTTVISEKMIFATSVNY
jgi:hypothetical protein